MAQTGSLHKQSLARDALSPFRGEGGGLGVADERDVDDGAAEADFVTLIDDADDVPASSGPPWKVAIIDDDPAVHDGTRFALQDYRLYDRGLDLISARSAAEGRQLLARHPDIAVVLLDVVMETESAGLDLVDVIRKELKNETVRIILRTGQPGQAPEHRVIVDYDINDYKAKTELTAEKLFTAMTAALRSHEQLQRLHQTRRGLELIIEAAATLFDFKSMQRLAEGVLTQLASLLAVECAGILVLREEGGDALAVLAGSGCYQHLVAPDGADGLGEEIRRLVHEAFARRAHDFSIGRTTLYIGTGSGHEVVVVLDASRELTETDTSLVEVFCSRLSVAFDNVSLYEQIQKANVELENRVVERTRELTLANERLEAQTARLKRANAFKNEILGTVAHDLKNPLAVILGRTEMLTELLPAKPLPEAEARAQVDHIRDSARRLTRMVESRIADAMADALDISIRRRPFDLAALARQMVEANRGVAEKKGQTLLLEGTTALPLRGDQDQLGEAIDNLLSNAVKYSPVGGAITVSVAEENGEASLRVRDQGPGLSPEDMSRLFGRFQRLSAKPTGGESSTGLGLSIAKRIVDLHGGRLFVEAASGGGAVFTITLPIPTTPAWG